MHIHAPQTVGDDTTAEALLFMVSYAKDHSMLDQAESFATRFLTLPYRVPEAKAVLRETRSITHAGPSAMCVTDAIFEGLRRQWGFRGRRPLVLLNNSMEVNARHRARTVAWLSV